MLDRPNGVVAVRRSKTADNVSPMNSPTAVADKCHLRETDVSAGNSVMAFALKVETICVPSRLLVSSR